MADSGTIVSRGAVPGTAWNLRSAAAFVRRRGFSITNGWDAGMAHGAVLQNGFQVRGEIS